MPFRRTLNVLAVGLIVVGTTTACATKKFVRTEVDAVGTARGNAIAVARNHPGSDAQNQAAITKVDAKADQVGIWAKDAQTSASNAQQAALPLSGRVAVGTKSMPWTPPPSASCTKW